MLVRDAKAIARRWVHEHALTLPGFVGAFHHGSTAHLPDDAIPSPTSDIDVMLVFEEDIPTDLSGKRNYEGVLLEISPLHEAQVSAATFVLSHYHLAPSFAVPSIISDPTGRLTDVYQAVAREFAQRRWVIRRCEHAQRNATHYLQALEPTDPLHIQAMNWLFAAGILTHILLVAGLRNPTVRTRYLAVRGLLSEYGHSDFYATLIDPLGCSHLTPERVQHHLDALAPVFDLAATRTGTGLPYASDITPAARPIAIDGSRALIARGDHLEAVFWIAVTFSRCLAILDRSTPPDHSGRPPGAPYADFIPALPDAAPLVPYRALLADLGIQTYDDIRRRCEQVADLIPHVWQVAESIIAANPRIKP